MSVEVMNPESSSLRAFVQTGSGEEEEEKKISWLLSASLR